MITLQTVGVVTVLLALVLARRAASRPPKASEGTALAVAVRLPHSFGLDYLRPDITLNPIAYVLLVVVSIICFATGFWHQAFLIASLAVIVYKVGKAAAKRKRFGLPVTVFATAALRDTSALVMEISLCFGIGVLISALYLTDNSMWKTCEAAIDANRADEWAVFAFERLEGMSFTDFDDMIMRLARAKALLLLAFSTLALLACALLDGVLPGIRAASSSHDRLRSRATALLSEGKLDAAYTAFLNANDLAGILQVANAYAAAGCVDQLFAIVGPERALQMIDAAALIGHKWSTPEGRAISDLKRIGWRGAIPTLQRVAVALPFDVEAADAVISVAKQNGLAADVVRNLLDLRRSRFPGDASTGAVDDVLKRFAHHAIERDTINRALEQAR